MNIIQAEYNLGRTEPTEKNGGEIVLSQKLENEIIKAIFCST